MRRLSLIPATMVIGFVLLQGSVLGAGPPLSLPAPEQAAAPSPAGKEEGDGLAENPPGGEASFVGEEEDEVAESAGGAPSPALRDPLEPVNRLLFVFNDKAYFWVMKPVAQGYKAVIPEGARVSVRNFFSNLATPIRFVNALLQGKFKDSGIELLRFTINTTAGIGGLFDIARKDFHLERRDEDLGQTLGVYGLGHGIYVVLPLLGPSSLRDAAGLAGDAFLDPVNYLDDLAAIATVKAFKAENEVSLTIGDYEDMKKASVDPYAAVRDAYVQHRAQMVEK